MARQNVLVAIVVVASILHTVSFTATTSANLTADTSATAYDVLEQNNLPRGLLPQGVQSYTLNAGGALEVTLPSECNFFVTVAGKQYQFRYARNIGGVIRSGSIGQVHGVRMQVAFAWLGLIQVDHVGDQLNIQVEKSTQSFPYNAFSQSPRCS
ncbi:hypothetical protein ACP70R_009175 [Stipagrostis hirtigluma subsp. patula]